MGREGKTESFADRPTVDELPNNERTNDMSKFNTSSVKTARTATSPIASASVPGTVTHEGAAGYVREPKSELFLAAVSSFLEDTFYEKADDRTKRLTELTQVVVTEDPDWILRFVTWLRGDAQLRSVPLVIAIEAARALRKSGMPGGRRIVSAALQRADEPGEAIAYWHSKYGRRIPQPIKRGIADAAVRLYKENSLFKYDTPSHSVRFADVIQLTHPAPKAPWQNDLFKFALDRRYDPKAKAPESLRSATARAELKGLSGAEIRKMANEGTLTEYLRNSKMTWEALSSVIEGGMDAKAWEAVIPVMGYMALLRNLRNFLDAGVSSDVLDKVAARISDPTEVANSKQLPFRFYSAYRSVQHSTVFLNALEKALNHSISNVPVLKGNTLILVDRSGSMFNGWMSQNSEASYAEQAALFGSALALRAEKATLVQYGTTSSEITFRKGASILPLMKKYGDLGGTYTAQTLRQWYNAGYDRVIVITDEQAHGWSWPGYEQMDVSKAIPENVPLYTWNLVGYRAGSTPSSANRLTFGGLSDKAFEMIGLIEMGRNADWPF